MSDSASSQQTAPGALKSAIANAMVAIFKEHYGLGPTAARTFLEDDFVFVVMQGGVTRNERTLLEAGHAQLVRDYRQRFQEAVSETSCDAIGEIVGRRVIGHHSQILFDPDMTFEIFVLEGAETDGV